MWPYDSWFRSVFKIVVTKMLTVMMQEAIIREGQESPLLRHKKLEELSQTELLACRNRSYGSVNVSACVLVCSVQTVTLSLIHI